MGVSLTSLSCTPHPRRFHHEHGQTFGWCFWMTRACGGRQALLRVTVQQNVQDLHEGREEKVQLTSLVQWVLASEKMPWLLISASRRLSAFAEVGSTDTFCKDPCPAGFVFQHAEQTCWVKRAEEQPCPGARRCWATQKPESALGMGTSLRLETFAVQREEAREAPAHPGLGRSYEVYFQGYDFVL